MTKNVRRLFSESFKKEKVEQIESGQITVHKLSNMLELGDTAIYRWLKKYGTKDYKSPVIVIETESEYLKWKNSEGKIHHMENLLGKQLIKIEYYEELLKVAGEHFQVDIKEKFLKKS